MKKIILFLFLFSSVVYGQRKPVLTIPQGGTSDSTAWGALRNFLEITPTLRKLQNTTDTSVIFLIPVPANSWLDGQTILIKELYFYSTYDATDTVGFGIDVLCKIGDSIIFSQNRTGIGCAYPDTCIDVFGMQFRRIGNDIIIINGNGRTAGNSPPGFLTNTDVNLGDSYLFGLTTDVNKPNYFRLHNINFAISQNITITINFEFAGVHDYIEARSATVWKY